MGTARGTASRVMSRGNRETRAGSSEQERGGLCGRGSRPRCPPPTPRAVGLTLPRALSLHVPAARGVQMPRRERGLGLGALAAWLRAVGAAAGRGRAGPAHSAARPAPGPEGGRRRVARLRRTGFAGNRRCAVPAGVCFDPEHLGSAAGPRVPPGRRGVQRGSLLTWGWDRGAVREAARAAGAGGTGTAPRAAERGGDAHSVSRFTEHPRNGGCCPPSPSPRQGGSPQTFSPLPPIPPKAMKSNSESRAENQFLIKKNNLGDGGGPPSEGRQWPLNHDAGRQVGPGRSAGHRGSRSGGWGPVTETWRPVQRTSRLCPRLLPAPSSARFQRPTPEGQRSSGPPDLAGGGRPLESQWCRGARFWAPCPCRQFGVVSCKRREMGPHQNGGGRWWAAVATSWSLVACLGHGQ